MQEIILTDQQARIHSITNCPVTSDDTVYLEWGGPDDREEYDFALELLGKVASKGRCLHNHPAKSWVRLDGHCKLGVGDTIPYTPSETEPSEPLTENDLNENQIDTLWNSIAPETRCEMCRDSFNIGARMASSFVLQNKKTTNPSA